ncbi:hypothetical protein LTR37_004511 [Vermiconidia calcicola]|uniref:Uncharacterized protein n=1 Tax=Vermiconidia calcicola TaxID=1690605 RepID=A0ACC3NMZ4_9PEZI|nr:hypothetical protein LTR37_004511 [Vermiconidia calcicola]
MKLLNAAALIYDNIAELVDFPDESNLPPYAILSHTWADEEVLFGDIALGPQHEVHPSLATLRASHQQASWSDDLDFSDAESLNSDFTDSGSLVSCGAHAEPDDDSSQSGVSSTKPPMHDQRQRSVDGSPADLTPVVDADLTQSPKQELRGPHVKLGWNKVLNTCLLACRDRLSYRMSWASKRTTTRIEDEAYCLLWIFGINMPLLYGEGRKAFQRLQEEIIKLSTDQSVFAWELRPWLEDVEREEAHSLLAPSTGNFWWHVHDITPFTGWTDAAVQLTNEGARLQLPLHRWRQDHGCNNSIALLQCSTERLGSCLYMVGLRLQNSRAYGQFHKTDKAGGFLHTRVEAEVVSTVEEKEPTMRRLTRIAMDVSDDAQFTTHPLNSLLISRKTPLDCSAPLLPPTFSIVLMLPPDGSFGYKWRVVAAYPSSEWDAARRTFELPVRQRSTFVAVCVEEMHGFRCFVVMGRMTEYCQSADVSGKYGIWIFDRTAHVAIEESGLDHNASTTNNPKTELQLQQACGDVWSLARKDYFRCTERCYTASKICQLPNGEFLGGFFGLQDGSHAFFNMTTEGLK